jgi:UDP:flavonoid glycosyltransferase YjiC (YdhE family)
LKVLFVSEAAEGLGHIYPWIELFKVLIANGVELHIACPSPRELKSVFTDGDVKLYQSWFPSMHSRPEEINSESWEQILKSLGYASVQAVGACMNQWLRLMRAIDPKLVLGDYSPIAGVAASVIGLPMFQLGTGYCTPPKTSAAIHLLPHAISTIGRQGFPSEEQFPDSYIAKKKLIATFHSVYASLKLQRLDDPIQSMLHYGAERFVATEPILDPYRLAREPGDCRYIGHTKTPVIKRLLSDEFPQWCRDPSRLKVLVYLKQSGLPLEQVVNLLQSQIKWDSAILLASEKVNSSHNSPNVKFISQSVNLSIALDGCDVFVTNGGLHGLTEALKKNKLIVIVPRQAEQAASAIELSNLATVKVAMSAEAVIEAIKRLNAYKLSNTSLKFASSTLFSANQQDAELLILSQLGIASLS